MTGQLQIIKHFFFEAKPILSSNSLFYDASLDKMFRRVWEYNQMVWAQLIQLRRYSEKKRHPFECAFYSISMYNVKIINGRVPFKVVRCHIGFFSSQ